MSQPGWRSRVARAFREERAAVLLAAGIALIMVLFLLVPVLEAIAVGFYSDGEISGYWFMRVVSNPILMQELLNTA